MRIMRLVMLLTMLVFTGQAVAADLKTYAVLPFKINGSDNFKYLENAIPSMLSSRLFWKDHFEPKAEVSKATSFDAASIAKLQDQLKTDYLIYGEVTIVGDEASVDVRVHSVAGKEWRKNSKSRVTDLISNLQNTAEAINADLFGRATASKTNSQSQASNMVNQMNPNLVHNESTQRQVYLNPQFRYQGNDGTRLRSQTLPFAAMGMAIADVNGDGKNEIVILSEYNVHVYTWDKDRLVELGKHKLPNNLTTMLVRTIDLDRSGAAAIVVTTLDQEHTEPYSFVLSFKNNKFTEIGDRIKFFLNVVRIPPDFTPALIGQRGDAQNIFSRGGVHEVIKQGDSFNFGVKLNLPTDANVLNFGWLPGKDGSETDKLLVISRDEKLRVHTPQGARLYQSDEKFSGSPIGIAEQNNMPGMGKSSVIIPSMYFVPMRLVVSDLERDGTYEVMVNKPISVSAQFFEHYRSFPEGEIHTLFWDGVGMSLLWKTRRIKGSVVDYQLADPNNDGINDLTVLVNTHPGAIGLKERKSLIVVYPLDLDQTDAKTAPVLE